MKLSVGFHLFLGLAMIVPIGCSAAHAPAAGSECIAGVRLNLAVLSDADRTRAINWFENVGQENRSVGLGGIAIRSERVYFQFRENCESKRLLVESILSKMRREHATFPEYEFLRDPIAPSQETIDLDGVSWPAGSKRN